MNKFWIILWRFQPIHLWHENVIKTMITNHKIENCLIIVWSINKPKSEQNPYSFKQRKYWIKKLFPDVKVVWLKDYSTDERRFIELEKIIQKTFYTGFEAITFYWWSIDDIKFFLDYGKNCFIVDRGVWDCKHISWTNLRDDMKNHKNIESYLNPQIVKYFKT